MLTGIVQSVGLDEILSRRHMKTQKKELMKKIYISGKISGLPLETARELIQKAAKRIYEMGFEPVNPMKEVPFNPHFKWEDYMLADIRILFDCDTIYMLNNWEDSRGAQIEHYIALQTQKTIIYEA